MTDIPIIPTEAVDYTTLLIELQEAIITVTTSMNEPQRRSIDYPNLIDAVILVHLSRIATELEDLAGLNYPAAVISKISALQTTLQTTIAAMSSGFSPCACIDTDSFTNYLWMVKEDKILYMTSKVYNASSWAALTAMDDGTRKWTSGPTAYYEAVSGYVHVFIRDNLKQIQHALWDTNSSTLGAWEVLEAGAGP